MKPLNSKETGCNPISSNCVIWQGPDIPCMNLCKGDTVSDVLYKAATEICQILDILNVSAYDLSCFNLVSCSPADFQELVQFLISRICNLEICTGCAPGCGNEPIPIVPQPTNGCPDCEVTIATCFQYVNGLGDTVTAMQIVDYVTAIGNRVCSLIAASTITNATVDASASRIGILETQVTQIINNPTPLPNLNPVCVLSPIPGGYSLDLVLAALEEQFCLLRDATGNVTDIQVNIIKQCAGLNDASRLAGSGSMSSIPGWTSSVGTMAASMGNIWLTICDMRTAILNIQANCCPGGCDGIVLALSSNLVTNILTLFITGDPIPAGFVQCTGTTIVTVKDSAGGTYTFTFNLPTYLNSYSGLPIDLDLTPVNKLLPITVDIDTCFTNPSTGTTCSSCLTSNLSGSITCPPLTVTAISGEEIGYSFISLSGNYTYVVQVYDSTGITLITSQTQTATTPVPIAGTFTGLTAVTDYKVRLSIVVTACDCCVPTLCEFSDITTGEPTDCPPPDDAIATIIP